MNLFTRTFVHFTKEQGRAIGTLRRNDLFLQCWCSRSASRKSLSTMVTTPIFYVNSNPHIGHLYTALLADAYVRYQVLKGNGDSLIFATGTDEHGMKVEKAAAEAGRGVQEHCDIVSQSFRRMCNEFDVNYTDFIRTTDERHKDAVAKFWTGLEEKGYIYKCHYEGWYSIADEAFVPEVQVLDTVGAGGQKYKISVESGHKVEWFKEENYMFRLKDLGSEVLKWIRRDRPILPEKFESMVTNWLEEGLQDLSVSRPRSRLSWGIPVPSDPSQVIYVWLDALVNYLTVAGYPGNPRWPPMLQVVGKDILKFHAIYWPAFLMANGLEPPRKILCHSHWTIDNVKMSKSLGNVVDPFKLKEGLGSEAVRYFLLSQGVPHSDGNFNEGKMIKMVNTALADTLGNLLKRCSSPALNPQQIWPSFSKDSCKFLSRHGLELKTSLETLTDEVEASFEELNFYRGIEKILAVLRQANLFVQEEKPWELVKSSPRSPQLLAMMALVLETLRVSGILLWPIIPSLSTSLLDRLNVDSKDRSWANLRPFIWETEIEEKALGQDQKMFFQRIKAN